MSARFATAVHGHRAGMTLLEVLVACGILVIGLSSIAALLPAAGSRLAQATLADRAGVVSANAYAEVLNRGLAAADMFSDPSKACVFGKELAELPTVAGAVTGTASGVLASRIDVARGFLLEDDLIYVAGTGDLPVNAFDGTVRSFKPGVCWGAMLACSGNAAVGMPATLSIAVFKKEGGPPKALSLTGGSGAMWLYTTGSSNGIADEADRKTYLSACSYVLLANAPPRWARVTASWTMPGPIVSGTENPAGRKSYVVLDPPMSGTTLSVIAFEGLVQVDQYPVTLQ